MRTKLSRARKLKRRKWSLQSITTHIIMKHFTFDVPEFIFKLADDIKSKAIETGFNRAVTKLIPGHSCNFL